MTIIDLTHEITAGMPVYPGTEPPVFHTPCTIAEHGFTEMEIKLYTHTGTHLDSPAHLFQGGLTLDRLPASQFIGQGFILDCSGLPRGEEIGLQQLVPVEDKLQACDFLLLYTGWSKKWGDNAYFQGYPVLSNEAAGYVTSFKCKGIGVDAISVDHVDSHELPVHHQILGSNMIIVENLTNLAGLVNQSFTFCCFPLKIKAADGSPVRAVAVVD